MVTPDKQFLIDTFEPLRSILHAALPEAAEIADGHFSEFDMHPDEYLAGRAHLARCHARRLILREMSKSSCGAWHVAKPGSNGRLWLSYNGLQLRLLRPLAGTVSPPPGYNPTRVAYYSNTHSTLLGVAGSNLIGLWEVDGAGDATIRIVRPKGRWKYGSSERVDIDFPLPKTESLADLEFKPIDDLGIELPYETEDEKGKEERRDESGG